MTQIKSIFNTGGKKKAKTGLVKINSYNVSPDTFLAAASPVTIRRDQLDVADYFKVTSGGATNELDLPSAANIGEVITLFAVAAFELRTEVDADLLNNVSVKGFALAAGSIAKCTKVSAAAWSVQVTSIVGSTIAALQIPGVSA